MRKLRIFYASDTTPNPWFKGISSNLWRANLYMPLVDLGHEVVEFDYDLTQVFRNLDPAVPRQAAFIQANRPRTSAALLHQIKTAHAKKPIDLFFSYFFDACVLPETLDEIRRLGIMTVNWYCNAAHQLHLVSEISPRYDYCLVPEKFRLADYQALGARPIYCQEAANPNIYKPHDVSLEFAATFVGQAYGDRPAFVEYLRAQGIDVRVHGHGWQIDPRYPPAEGSALLRLPAEIRGGPLADDEMIKMYSRSKINLGFSTCGETHEAERTASGERIVQIRLRDFEVPMSGGFYMVEHQDELAEFFALGKEIVCYRSREDLAEKIRYYLAHEMERRGIAQAGRERCLREHTWHKRFEKVFREMGLD